MERTVPPNVSKYRDIPAITVGVEVLAWRRKNKGAIRGT